MKFGEPLETPPPPARRRGKRQEEVLKQLEQTPQGKWLPIDLSDDIKSAPLNVVSGMKKLGYECYQVEHMVYIKQHSHHWIINASGNSQCKDCGKSKEFDGGMPQRKFNDTPVFENSKTTEKVNEAKKNGAAICPNCQGHWASTLHKKTCLERA